MEGEKGRGTVEDGIGAVISRGEGRPGRIPANIDMCGGSEGGRQSGGL